MAGTLKEITENYEKLHKLKMIQSTIANMYNFVADVVGRLYDDFDDCEDFENYITDSVIKYINERIPVLKQLLDNIDKVD